MKKITVFGKNYGPYEMVEVLEDRYRVNGSAELPFTVIGEGTVDDVVEGDFPAPSNIPTEEQTADQAQAIRDQRLTKLRDSDWTQVLDAPVDQTAWASYRQSLRDVTKQTGFPWTVEWPVSP